MSIAPFTSPAPEPTIPASGPPTTLVNVDSIPGPVTTMATSEGQTGGLAEERETGNGHGRGRHHNEARHRRRRNVVFSHPSIFRRI